MRTRAWAGYGLAAVLLCPVARAQDAAVAEDAAPDATADVDSGLEDADQTDAAAAASTSAPVRPTPPPITFGPLESFDLAQGIQVTVQAPSDWQGVDVTTDIPDLNQVDGAQVKVSRAWTAPDQDDGRILLVCIAASSKDWAHGLESLLFERMNGVAKTELAKSMTVSTFSSGAAVETPFGYQEDFQALGQAGADVKQGGVRVLEPEGSSPRHAARMTVLGRHSLAFSRVEEPPLVLTCSLACAEHARRHGAVCTTALGTHRLVGETGPEPVPSLRARFVAGFARRPAAMAGVAAGLLFLLAGVAAVVRGLLFPSRA